MLPIAIYISFFRDSFSSHYSLLFLDDLSLDSYWGFRTFITITPGLESGRNIAFVFIGFYTIKN